MGTVEMLMGQGCGGKVLRKEEGVGVAYGQMKGYVSTNLTFALGSGQVCLLPT